MLKLFRQLPVFLFLLILPLSACSNATDPFAGWWKASEENSDKSSYIELSFDGSPSLFNYTVDDETRYISKVFYTKAEVIENKLVFGLPGNMEFKWELNEDKLTSLPDNDIPSISLTRDKDFGKSDEVKKATFNYAAKIENPGLKSGETVLQMSLTKKQISISGELESITGEKSLQLFAYSEYQDSYMEQIMIQGYSGNDVYVFAVSSADGEMNITKVDATNPTDGEIIGSVQLEKF